MIKALSISAAVLALTVSSTAMSQLLIAEPMQPIEPITQVSPLVERDDFVLCGGANHSSGPSAYFQKGTDLTGRMTSIIGKSITQLEGGTVTCARALADGSADAAIMQDDLVPWLVQTDSPLTQHLAYSGSVMTEAIMAFCHRDGETGGKSDFGSIAQKKKFVIALAGSKGAGANLTINAIAGEDSGWRKPQYIYAGSWEGAFNAVQDGKAACAMGVSNPNGEQWEVLDDQFGKDLRMMEVHDSDFWDIKGIGKQQLYGELTIDKKHEALDDFLSWRGNNKGKWSPEMPAFNASVYYRAESVPQSVQADLAKAVKSMSDTLPLKR